MPAIAIVGVGLSGAAFFINFIHLLASIRVTMPLKIILIDKIAVNGKGLAYGTLEDCNLLNTPATTCGILHGKPQDFSDWYATCGFSHNTDAKHPPRWLYGRYVAQRLCEYRAMAESLGIQVACLNVEVAEIKRCESTKTLSILFAKNAQLPVNVDKIVLCLGAFASEKFRKFLPCENYYHCPYDQRFMEKVNNHADILVIGSRLSAIDVILMLKHHGFQGKIHCVSRGARLPVVRGEESYLERHYLTHHYVSQCSEVSLRQIIHLIIKELDIYGCATQSLKEFLKKTHNHCHFLSEEISKSGAERLWQSLFYHNDLLVNTLWKKLDVKSQRKVKEKYYDLFLCFRAAMPLCTAKKLVALMEAHQLFFRSGLREMVFQDPYFCALFKQGAAIQATQLVNASGVTTDILKTHDPLIKNLLKNSLIIPNALRGIAVNTDTYQSKAVQGKDIYVLGALVTGEDIMTNLIEYIVATTSVIATHLLDKLA